MEPAEVAEIQEEDRHTAELLEMLMAEFEARLQSHPEPLDQFVSDYWWRRMGQVEAEMDQIGDDDIQAMRDIGIRFESESESSSECESAASDEA
ncbi:ankyrin repeat protein [Colletotrichum higginsianum]|nr:ankyrin repeat protein [Colletotrichum higginsianum]